MRRGTLSLSVSLLVGILFFPALSLEAPSTIPNRHTRVFDLTGEAKRLPQWEQETIMRIAGDADVDARLLAAVRLIENGSPGREFGVLSVPAPTYEDQGRVAAETIRNVIERYQLNIGRNPVGPDGEFSVDFLRYFSRGGPGYLGYAPIGAMNDPGGLNVNHYPKLLTFYWSITTLRAYGLTG